MPDITIPPKPQTIPHTPGSADSRIQTSSASPWDYYSSNVLWTIKVGLEIATRKRTTSVRKLHPKTPNTSSSKFSPQCTGIIRGYLHVKCILENSNPFRSRTPLLC